MSDQPATATAPKTVPLETPPHLKHLDLNLELTARPGSGPALMDLRVEIRQARLTRRLERQKLSSDIRQLTAKRDEALKAKKHAAAEELEGQLKTLDDNLQNENYFDVMLSAMEDIVFTNGDNDTKLLLIFRTAFTKIMRGQITRLTDIKSALPDYVASQYPSLSSGTTAKFVPGQLSNRTSARGEGTATQAK